MTGAVSVRRAGAAILLGLCLVPVIAVADNDPRVVLGNSGFEYQRGELERIDPGSLLATKVTAKSAPAGKSNNSQGVTVQAAECCGHYIYSGFTEVLDDTDFDGFYSYLRINVDVDTNYAESDIYLQAYLRGSFGGWHKIYESNVFTIFGTSQFDDYEIETELVSGFAPDYYDVLIEVYDAYTGDKMISYGVHDNPSFSQVPLEDVNRDGGLSSPIVSSFGTSGGGALSVGVLLALGLVGLGRRLRL